MLQTSINNFVDWCKKKNLELNRDKFVIMTFIRRQKSIMNNYTMDGQKIRRVTEVRDLGVMLDQKLSFGAHKK